MCRGHKSESKSIGLMPTDDDDEEDEAAAKVEDSKKDHSKWSLAVLVEKFTSKKNIAKEEKERSKESVQITNTNVHSTQWKQFL